MYKALVLVITMYVFSSFALAKPTNTSVTIIETQTPVSEKSMDAIKEAIQIIRSTYVNELTEDELTDAAINGMLTSLDPHSGFLNQEDLQEINVSTAGEFGGVGIEVAIENGMPKIITAVDDSPASKAGIKSGDIITSIDDVNAYGFSSQEIINKIRGIPSTEVKLSILRKDDNLVHYITLRRENIKIKSVKTAVLAASTLYIRISTFKENTHSSLIFEAQKALSNKKNKISGVIIDLRNNPGGIFDQAIKVASIFLDKGDVVHTKGRNKNVIETLEVESGKFKILDLPLIVLINHGSASAAEIVAGALQDHKRAVVLGMNSFGKGSVQNVMFTQREKAISLTTAVYYTPKGTAIQVRGISPDIEIDEMDLKQITDQTLTREQDLKQHIKHTNNLSYSVNEKNSWDYLMKQHVGSSDYSKVLQKPFSDDYFVLRALDLIRAINLHNTSTSWSHR